MGVPAGDCRLGGSMGACDGGDVPLGVLEGDRRLGGIGGAVEEEGEGRGEGESC